MRALPFIPFLSQLCQLQHKSHNELQSNTCSWWLGCPLFKYFCPHLCWIFNRTISTCFNFIGISASDGRFSGFLQGLGRLSVWFRKYHRRILARYVIYTLKRNRNATLFQLKIHGVVFKVLDGDNKPSRFQELQMNSTKQCLKWLTIKKKHIPIMITSISAYVNVSYFLHLRRFQTYLF